MCNKLIKNCKKKRRKNSERPLKLKRANLFTSALPYLHTFHKESLEKGKKKTNPVLVLLCGFHRQQ